MKPIILEHNNLLIIEEKTTAIFLKKNCIFLNLLFNLKMLKINVRLITKWVIRSNTATTIFWIMQPCVIMFN